MKHGLAILTFASLASFGCNIKKPLTLVPMPQPQIQAELPILEDEEEFPINLDNFSYDNSPEIKQALKEFSETGKAPVVKRAGFVQYPFGEVQPILNCQENYGCDVELQAGEEVQAVILGNAPLWDYLVWESNQEHEATPHVTIAPRVASTKTNAIIGTNRRTYHLELLSSKKSDYVRSAKYYYPRERLEEFLASKRKKRAVKAAQDQRNARESLMSEIANSGGLPYEYISFGWEIDAPKRISWKPSRVFDDGSHIYLQFPENVVFEDFPGIYIPTKGGNLSQVTWRTAKPSATKSREKGTYLMVDGMYQELHLIGGFNGEEEVIIRKKK